MTPTIDDLADRLAVSDVVTTYFQAMDRHDWDGIRTLIASKMTLNAGGLASAPTPQSRDDFMDELIARNAPFALSGCGSFHANPGHLVSISGDHATVTAHMIAGHWVGPADADFSMGYGMYELDLVREGGAWKLSGLAMEIKRLIGEPPGEIMRRAAALQTTQAGR